MRRHAALILIFVCSIAMGLGAVFGITGEAEPWLWAAIALAVAVTIVKTHPDRPVLYAFLISFVAMTASFVAAAGFDLYLQNNPSAADAYKRLPANIPPRLFVVLTAPFVALIYALVTAAMTWLVTKIAGRKPAQA